ncbi:MAG TPA: glycosyltransferase [Candidatus Saccharimonadales bacterium]|nr:glycosyltransferase [Candidatus Saccharimonadales bacterium]
MRVLMIADHSDPLAKIGTKESGGQNVYVLNLAKFLVKLGAEVDIYTRWDKITKTHVVTVAKGLRVIRVKAGPKHYMPRDNFLYVVEEFTANVRKFISEEHLHYDIIHSNYWFSGIIGMKLARQLKLPQVHVYHSIGQIRFNALKEYIAQQEDYVFFQTRASWERKIAQTVNGVVATSPIEQEEIHQFFDVPVSKITCIPIGVDTRLFQPGDQQRARSRLHLATDRPILLYVGRIEWRKGLEVLLHALAQLPPAVATAKLYIVGGGQNSEKKGLDKGEIDRLTTIAKELGIHRRVRFLGAKKQEEIAPYYVAADACVVPSLYEPFGIVPLEAMACGTPVIASRTGGLQYTVIDSKTGYLVSPGDASGMADRIATVLQKGKAAYSDAARQRVIDNFVWPKIAEATLHYMTSIINGASV